MHRYFTILILYGAIACLWVSCQKEKTSQQTQLFTPTQQALQNIYFLNNDSIGFAMGGSTYSQSTLLHTNNGGQTWSLVDLSFNKIVYDMFFISPSEGFLTGYDSKVLHTTDTGKTWIIEQLHGDLAWLPMYGIDFASPSTGVIVGGKGNSIGIIFQTTNGGQTWQQTYTSPSELRDIDFVNNTEAYAVGYGLVLKTNDSGETWQPLDAKGDFFFAVHFPTDQVGYVVGNQGTILKTSNSGYSWQTLRNGNSPFKKRLHFTDVWFKDTDNGFVLAENCLLQTTNGGQTWQQYDLLCHTNKGLYFRSSESALLIVGEQGCISQIEVP